MKPQDRTRSAAAPPSENQDSRSPDELRKLEQRLREQIEAERDDVLLEGECQGITRHLSRLESHAREILGPYVLDESALREPDLANRLFEWNNALAEGHVPSALRNLALGEAQDRIPDLLYYALLVELVRTDAERGLAGAQDGWWLVPNEQECALTEVLRAQGKLAEAMEYEQLLRLRSAEAATHLQGALQDLLPALRMALGLLAGMKVQHLVLGARTLRRLKEQATRVYRQAAVELFRRIIEGEGTRKLDDIWKWAGTTYYRTVELRGVQFTFRKSGTKLLILCPSQSDEPIHRQPYTPSTLYEWRKEALKPPGDSC
jgi:hypothetical protein